MELWERSVNIFWSNWFWFPQNITWADLENKEGGIVHPKITDLLVPFPIAFVLYIVRMVYENYVFKNFGLLCGLKEGKKRPVPPNPALENTYKQRKHPDEKQIQGLAKQNDMEPRQVERWFRLRRNFDRPDLMKKFTETGWRFTFYLSIFIYGLNTLWDTPWLWDSRYCWIGYPHHNLTPRLYWYYLVELGFYWSLMFSQFQDVKRKDFIEMFVHHCATIVLMSFSYLANFVRVGTLVLCIHDAVDYWLEGAKLAKYLELNRLCDCLFAVFGIIWFVTRLLFYPYKSAEMCIYMCCIMLDLLSTALDGRGHLKILYTTLVENVEIVGFFPSLIFFNIWLVVLLVLHAYWFSLIAKVTYDALTKVGEVQGDVRSSVEETVSEEEVDANSTPNHIRQG